MSKKKDKKNKQGKHKSKKEKERKPTPPTALWKQEHDDPVAEDNMPKLGGGFQPSDSELLAKVEISLKVAVRQLLRDSLSAFNLERLSEAMTVELLDVKEDDRRFVLARVPESKAKDFFKNAHKLQIGFEAIDICTAEQLAMLRSFGKRMEYCGAIFMSEKDGSGSTLVWSPNQAEHSEIW